MNIVFMATYISILRAINVRGKNIIKMDALRMMYHKLGFENVTTYLQSGNVIFTNPLEKPVILAQRITERIKSDFNLDVPVIVLTADQLKHIIDCNPFSGDPKKDPIFFQVTFLEAPPSNYDQSAITSKKDNEEEISFSDDAVYLYCPNGYGNTNLSNTMLESKLKVMATTRNWKTTNELYQIAKQII
jgi:uncharacterized protein (DUF1697 family)